MKQFVKTLSMILIFALLVNMLPMSIFAEQLQDDVVAELSPAKPDAPTSILHEITQKRTQYTKEFLLSNGLHLAVGQWDEREIATAIPSFAATDNTCPDDRCP